ncbi:transcription factor TFIID complex subunit [Pseudozyma hubeiensis SY62]|uniref:Transcription initiation factor TFIID subunit 13 n=1 Tax=Pseudozyma hubeiensis (strain SY62) TaxID=1305764 RepID=R9NXR2_PSEHS|nr:transcription factor TFIID complex subunit [Pseudozyma hubeiensis SY62]GAC93337.1 transcription factor TFIID complex subunit [Pseudozyma hubeiensis SY62]
MPPTPSRSTQRGSARQRQSSSLLPQAGPSASTIAAASGGRSSAQPAKGAKVTQTHDAGAVPFVHPALALSSGVLPSSSSTTGMPAAAAAQIRGRRPFNHRNLFARDLRNLMYAYGDSPNPDPDSVMLMEEMTVDFITDLCCRARPSPYSLGLGTSSISNSSSSFGATLEQHAAAAQDPNALLNGTDAVPQTLPPRAPHRLRVKLEDFRHALRKDVEAKKLGRMEQLLYADKVVTEARRVGGVEEAAERAGAMQTDNLPAPAANADGPSQDANLEDLDVDEDDSHDGKPAKSGKGKSKGGGGGKGGGKGKGKPKGGAAASRAGSARSSVAPA